MMLTHRSCSWMIVESQRGLSISHGWGLCPPSDAPQAAQTALDLGTQDQEPSNKNSDVVFWFENR